MKAITCRRFGPPSTLALEEHEGRKPRAGEVRIAVKAAGANFPDALMVAGTYQVKPDFPFTPGLEGAGIVTEAGEGVSHVEVGSRVLFIARRGGAFATEITMPAATVVPLPDEVDYTTAACFPITYGTAHFALTHRGHLAPGESVLVTGAAGGVGIAAIECARALGAGKIIAAAGGPDRLRIAQDHGADELIDYSREDIRARIKELTNGDGVDVVFDPVGGSVFDQCTRVLGWEGRLLVIGFASGEIPKAPANMILVKNYSVVGVVFGAHTERFPDNTRARLVELLDWLKQGRLKPHVSKTYPLADAARALEDLTGRRAVGKIALTME